MTHTRVNLQQLQELLSCSLQLLSAEQFPTIEQITANSVVAHLHYLRDGELVVYRRQRSRVWQCKFKLYTNRWHRVTTGKTDLQYAIKRAGEIYDEAKYRESMGLAVAQRTFADIALATVRDLQADLAVGAGKKIYVDYIGIIQRYFIPFFGAKHLQNLKHTDIAEFERWRNDKMKRKPKSSTLMNFASAFSRVCNTAINRGWISDKVPLPRMSRKGEKGLVRPGFNANEIEKLLAVMPAWENCANTDEELQRRQLLCDYVRVLLGTGVRHGTESQNIMWRNCEWHIVGEEKYMRIWVSGKTGGRYLIAKMDVIPVLQRLHSRQYKQNSSQFDAVLGRENIKIFNLTKKLPVRFFNDTFTKLLMYAELTIDTSGQARTLYSLRHTYATRELLAGTDIHTVARQMGTSVRMLEMHYSKLTATMAADKLA